MSDIEKGDVLVQKLKPYKNENWDPNKSDLDEFSLDVNTSIAFLQNYRRDLGLWEFLPPKFQIVTEQTIRYSLPNFDIKIVVDAEGWSPLSPQKGVHIASLVHLAEFINISRQIAESTRYEFGIIVVPDILKGYHHPSNNLQHFYLERYTHRLFFAGLYPLIRIRPDWEDYFVKRKFIKKLEFATEVFHYPALSESVRRFKSVILGSK